MEMILKFHGMPYWVAVHALLVVTHTAYMEKKAMTSQIKLLQRLAAKILQLLTALNFQTLYGVAQILMQIKVLLRICVLVKLLHVGQNP